MRSTRTARVARFHHAGELAAGTELTLSKSASHHLITVLRTRTGDVIELFNGNGYNYRATVLETGQRNAGKRALLQIHEATAAASESPVSVTLIQAISRGDKMDMILRQCVELGVTRIQPTYSRHSAKVLDDKRMAKKFEHWQGIVISASEQSGRGFIPELLEPLPLTRWTDEHSRNTGCNKQVASYVLSPLADMTLTQHLLQSQSSAQTIELLIGPESGLDPDEIDQAVAAGMQPVSMGPRILRCETAGPACLAVVQATLGDLGTRGAHVNPGV